MSEINTGRSPRVEELNRKIDEHINAMIAQGISNREKVEIMTVLEISKTVLMISLTRGAIFEGVV